MKLIKSKVEILDNINGEDVVNRIAQVARTCYKSEDKSSYDNNKALVERLIKSNHDAMLEFFDITVRFTCSRSISHEIVRHRVASYAQESQRYCNYSKDKFNNEITFILPTKDVNDSFLKALEIAEQTYFSLLQEGWLPQEAREILPNATKTEINMKANLREWRHFLTLRCSTVAHPDMRALALNLLKQLHTMIPIIFDDIYEGYYKDDKQED